MSAPPLVLAAAQVVAMPHRGGPVMVHGIADPALAAGLGDLYAAAAEGTPIALECAWRLDAGRPVAALRVTAPLVLEATLVPDLDAETAGALAGRALVTASLYPDEAARGEAMADFRVGGVHGRWERLGVHLPAAPTDALRAG